MPDGLLAAVAQEGFATVTVLEQERASTLADALSADALLDERFPVTVQLLFRALARHCALAPPERRLPIHEREGVAFEEIVAEFGAHERGDPLAGSRAELLAWIVLDAVDESHWPELGVEVLDTLIAACVLGAEGGGPLGRVWRDTVGALITVAAERARRTGERHAPFSSGLLGSFAQRVGQEAGGDLGAHAVALAALESALAIADDDERWALTHEAAVRALDFFQHGGPPSTVALALKHADAAATLAAGDARAALLTDYTRARILSEQARLTESEPDQERALALWRRLVANGDAPASGRGRTGMGLNLASELGVIGARRGELALIDEALALLDTLATDEPELALEQVASRANRLRTRYDLTGDRDDLDAAIAASEHAVELAAREPPATRSRLLNNLAVKLRARFRDFGGAGDIERSLELQQRALTLVPEGRRERTRWEGNLGNAFRELAEVTGRREHFERATRHTCNAVEATDPGTIEHWEHVNSLLVASSAAEDLSLERLDELLELAERLLAFPAPPVTRRRWQANVAALVAARCERSGALADAERALALWREALAAAAPGSPERLGLLTSLGSGLMLLSDVTGDTWPLAEAVAAQRQVVEAVRRRGALGPAAALELVNYANALAAHGDATLDLDVLQQAVAAATEALTLVPSGPRALAAAGAVGNAYLTSFEITTQLRGGVDEQLADAALDAYRAAVDSLEPGDPRYAGQAGNLANGLFQVGLATRDVERLEEATRWYAVATADEHAAGQAQRLANLAMAALTVAAHTPQPATATEQLAVAEHALADAEAAAPEHQRALHFRLAIGRTRLAVARGDDAAVVVAAEQALARSRHGVRSAHADYAEAHLRPTERLPSLGALAHLREHGPEAALAYLERSRALLLVQASVAVGEHVLDGDGVRGLAERLGEPIVYALAGSGGGALLVCTPETVRAIDVPELTSGRAAQAARALRFHSPEQPDALLSRFVREVRAVAGGLGTWAGAELAALLETHTRATLVPVGDLAHLPWGAAVVDGQPLLARGPLRTAVSATLLATTAERAAPARTATRARIVAHPMREDRFPLPSAEHEALAVERALRAAGFVVETLRGEQATVAATLDGLGDFDVLHFACHTAERLRARDTALLLTGGELRAAAIATAARLVYLSACSTGQVELGLADEGISLASSLLTSGADAVVSTLWPVDDETSLRLAERFYSLWRGGADIPAALALAQSELAREGAEPWLWAGLIASGI